MESLGGSSIFSKSSCRASVGASSSAAFSAELGLPKQAKKPSPVLFRKAFSSFLIERSMRNEEKAFLKSTGDGFFACFGSPSSALKAALELAPTLARQLDFENMELPPRLSIALHWGPS